MLFCPEFFLEISPNFAGKKKQVNTPQKQQDDDNGKLTIWVDVFPLKNWDVPASHVSFQKGIFGFSSEFGSWESWRHRLGAPKIGPFWFVFHGFYTLED